MLVHFFPPVMPAVHVSGRDRTALGALRRIHRAATWSTFSWPERLLRLAAWPVWPLVALASSLCWQLPRHGRRGRVAGGRAIALQLLDQLRLAVTARMWPHHYYMFELYRVERRARAKEYLLRQETKHGVFSILKDAPRKNRVFARKDAFAAACAAAGLPHAAPIARLSTGDVTWLGGHHALPETDLFVKPVIGQGGRGADCWIWRGGAYEGMGGERETAAALLARLQRRAARADILVLPRLANHPDFTGLTLGALATLRIVTCRNEENIPEAVAAALRLARGAGAVVDNFHAGGLAAIVDLASGRLGQATDIGLARDSAWHGRHPVTGAAIEGFLVPCWPAAKALAEAAHLALGDRVVVGWDVAILPDGPCLIEANGFPDLDIIQRCGGLPLGRGRLCHLLVLHLRRHYPIWRQRHGLPVQIGDAAPRIAAD